MHTYIHTNIHKSSIYKNALHDLTLFKILVACSVGAEAVLIRYFNGHTKHIQRSHEIKTPPIKENRDYF